MTHKTKHCFTQGKGAARLHWVERGTRGRRHPVVLLHGLNDCHLTWEKVSIELAADRRVIVPDLPGHGRSGRPNASYTLDWYAKVMARWLEELDYEQVDVVGHSFGAGVAQMLLLKCRQRVRRLALVAAGGLGREIGLALRMAAIPWPLIEHLGQPWMAYGTRLMAKSASRVVTMDYVDELVVMNSQRGSARAFARTVNDLIDWRGQRRCFFRRAHEIGELPPLAVFWGANDEIVPTKHGHALASFVEGVKLTIFKGCGHYVHQERPRELARKLRTFLDASPAAMTRFAGKPQAA